LLLASAFAEPQDPDYYNRRGIEDFAAARIKEAIADFDRAIELEPGLAPWHWQRGIALYFANRFDDCRRQFELHRTVNPEDVENSVWHFLCVARIKGVNEARKAYLPVHEDDRVPMMELDALYRGQSTPQKVIEKAMAGNAPAKERHVRLFY